jgi:hypothetical protein
MTERFLWGFALGYLLSSLFWITMWVVTEAFDLL